MRHRADTLSEVRWYSSRGPSRASAEQAARELLLRAIRARLSGDRSAGEIFLVRRAIAGTDDLTERRERTHTDRVIEAMADGSALPEALVAWAGYLEARSILGTAEATLDLAREMVPADPELTLHAARVVRKLGRLDHARILYDRVSALDRGDGPLSVMASIGRALTSEQRVRSLGAVLRRAVVSGEHEAAAVAQEERARARRAVGDVSGALRDYVAAAARYSDPIDRGRVGHEAADLLIGIGDLEGARRALLETERAGHPEQVGRARLRLQSIARAQGDQLGIRRYAVDALPALVSLSPPGKGRQTLGQAGAANGPGSTHRVLCRGLSRIADGRARA